MSATTMSSPDAPIESGAAEDVLEYRSVHTFSVLGMLLGMLSLVIFSTASTSLTYTLTMAPIAVGAVIVSLISLRQITADPDLYTGKQMAQTGALLGAFALLGGLGYAAFVHATEVPDGYARTSFIAMKPTEQDMVDRKMIPDDILEFISSGEPVFIKGYIRPDSIKYKQNLSDFLLVRDNMQCCFGDLSKVKWFDQVQVELAPGMTTDFHRGLFRIGGRLTYGPGDPKAQTPITFKIAADYCKS